jgi:hypothetical protein
LLPKSAKADFGGPRTDITTAERWGSQGTGSRIQAAPVLTKRRMRPILALRAATTPMPVTPQFRAIRHMTSVALHF